MSRNIQRNIHRTTQTEFAPLPTADQDEDALIAWLLEAFPGGQWLLAHTLNGVVWGQVQKVAERTALLTSTGRFPPHTAGRLRPAEIQSCRFFGEEGELLLWHNGETLGARLYQDHASDATASEQPYFDEAQILWGTQAEKESLDKLFTLVSDGVQGFCHAVPYAAAAIPFDPLDTALKQRPLRLVVRHYLAQDHDGAVTLGASRLVKLFVERI